RGCATARRGPAARLSRRCAGARAPPRARTLQRAWRNASPTRPVERETSPFRPSGAAVDQRSIAVIGTGNIGGTLGRKWAAAGHEVAFGVRDASSPRHQALVEGIESAAAV